MIHGTSGVPEVLGHESRLPGHATLSTVTRTRLLTLSGSTATTNAVTQGRLTQQSTTSHLLTKCKGSLYPETVLMTTVAHHRWHLSWARPGHAIPIRVVTGAELRWPTEAARTAVQDCGRLSPRGEASPKVYGRQFRCSGCHPLIHPELLVLLDGVLPAETEPEEGFEPSTFRLRVEAHPSSRCQPGRFWLLRCGTDFI